MNSIRQSFLCVLAVVILFFLATPVFGRNLAFAKKENVTITLTDEKAKCDAVPSFEYRILWEEPGKKYEGCFQIHGPFIIAYFPGDKSVALIPSNVFQMLSEM